MLLVYPVKSNENRLTITTRFDNVKYFKVDLDLGVLAHPAVRSNGVTTCDPIKTCLFNYFFSVWTVDCTLGLLD